MLGRTTAGDVSEAPEMAMFDRPMGTLSGVRSKDDLLFDNWWFIRRTSSRGTQFVAIQDAARAGFHGR